MPRIKNSHLVRHKGIKENIIKILKKSKCPLTTRQIQLQVKYDICWQAIRNYMNELSNEKLISEIKLAGKSDRVLWMIR